MAGTGPDAGAPLSPEERRHYAEQGYVVRRGLFSAEEVEVWNQRFLDIAEGRVEPAEDMLVMRDVMVAKGAVEPGSPAAAVAKIQDYQNDPVLYDGYAKSPRLLDLVEGFCGPDVKSIHTMLINKPPNVDGRHPLHQDLLYFPFRPADRIAAAWTALEPVDRGNGCLVAVPGAHRGALRRHGRPDWEYVNVAYLGATEIDDLIEQRVHLEMQPGDTVFFHPLLLHGSGRNRTDAFRRAISAHYSHTDVTWEWAGGDLKRPYRIVTGPRRGELWAGHRNTENPINPLDWITDNPEELIRVGEANHSRQ